jgi:predicted O-methyltransferase YrrM
LLAPGENPRPDPYDVEAVRAMTCNADGAEQTLKALLDREVFGEGSDQFDLDRLARLAAGLDSAGYYAERMGAAARAPDAASLLQLAFAARDPAGLVMEFGVASGGTANLLAGLTDGTIHGFDSFEGLPEDWRPGFPRGAFAHAIPRLRPNVSLEIGTFEETLPRFVARHRGSRIGFAHVDCDLYSSTRTVFEHCGPMIGPGTVIVFDEYFNYAGWRRHEFRAFQDFIAASGSTYEYIGVVPAGQQVAVLVTG